jgi:hypothetical protein
MKPVPFDQANLFLKRPPGMTEEECGDLPVHRDERGICVSCWELDGDELMKILETKQVWLWVFGGGSQPPVALSPDNPFESEDEGEPA